MKQLSYTNLYIKYHPDLLAYARSRCADESIAADIVQNVFLGLLERKERVQEIKNRKAYLFIMVRNEIVNHLRQEKLRQKTLCGYTQIQLSQTTYDYLLEKEYKQRLLKAIAMLPVQQGLVYQLHCEYNWKREQVAAMMHISPNTVKSHLQTMKKRLVSMVA